ncbi:hypothetical protein FSP39_022398 [Pinctada imbricata]|uniref:Tetraspanin n=1 Tax=Pinctada imbricata TaxID=66713 RepID=A0AA88Y5X4_PINIB|nr:hypothetical protein FSP39_022398 [Pinctada imbricata]
MTGALACLAKVTLGILNTLFLLVGLALVAVGAIIKQGSGVIGDVLGELKNVPAVSQYLDTAAWVLIGLGIFFTAIGILGGCGACCAVKIFLILYIIIVIILMLTQIVFIALLFSDKLKDILQSALKDSFSKYKPPPDPVAGAKIDTDDVLSRGLDALFIELKCCGFESSKDLTTASKTPVTCCKAFTPDLLKSDDPFGTSLIELQSCVSTGTNSYKDRGCYDALLDLIDDNKGAFIGGTVGILLFQLICVVFAVLIIKDKNKNSVSPIS